MAPLNPENGSNVDPKFVSVRSVIESLRSVEEPEFTPLVRKTITGFAFRWISSSGARNS